MLNDASKYGKDGIPMWESKFWTEYNVTVYRSNWWWSV